MDPDPVAPPAPPRPAAAPADWDPAALDPDYPDVDGVRLVDATIDLAGARTVTLLRSHLEDCTVTVGEAAPVAVQDCVLVGVDCTGWRIESLRRVRFERCRLAGIDAGDATIRDVTLAECAAELGSWRNATVERLEIRGGRIDGVDLSGVTATDVTLAEVALVDVTLDRFRATRVDLTAADLDAVDRLAELAGCTISPLQAVALAGRLARGLGLHVAAPLPPSEAP